MLPEYSLLDRLCTCVLKGPMISTWERGWCQLDSQGRAHLEGFATLREGRPVLAVLGRASVDDLGSLHTQQLGLRGRVRSHHERLLEREGGLALVRDVTAVLRVHVVRFTLKKGWNKNGRGD